MPLLPAHLVAWKALAIQCTMNADEADNVVAVTLVDAHTQKEGQRRRKKVSDNDDAILVECYLNGTTPYLNVTID